MMPSENKTVSGNAAGKDSLEGEYTKINSKEYVTVIRSELAGSPEIATLSDEEISQLGGLYCEYFAQGENIETLVDDIFKESADVTEDKIVTVAATIVAASIYLCPEYDYLAAEYLQ